MNHPLIGLVILTPAMDTKSSESIPGNNDGSGTHTYESTCESTSLQALFKRPFWRRVWIIQEIVKARNVQLLFGNDSLYWPFSGQYWEIRN